jgi:spore coat polysaccharide biosynthesis predicted glycosyltransferase SpsG
MPRVALLADAGPSVGLGHAVRSAALGSALSDLGATVTLALPDPVARDLIDAEGLRSMDWTNAWVEPIDIVVADSYRWSADDDTNALANVRLFVRILDGSTGEIRPHVVVDGAPGADAHTYRGPSIRARFVGPTFALVPRAFRATGQARGDRAVVSLGGAGSDALDAIVAALRDIGYRGVDVVLGPFASVTSLADVDVHRGLRPTGVASLFAAARLGVVGGGQTLLQAAAAGLPSIAVVLADNQLSQVRAMERAGALVAAIDRLDRVTLGETIRARAVPDAGHSEAAARATALVDGFGADRAAAGIMEIYGALAGARPETPPTPGGAS